ncbi:MAG: hypothetical protein WD449_02580, partial [Candidatus Babeliales bacterium]
TGCSGTWLLTGEGQMFEHDQPIENGIGPAMIRGAINLLSEFEQNAESLDQIDLPKDCELQLARLLVKILEQSRN